MADLPENVRRVIAAGDSECTNLVLDAYFHGWSYRQFAEALSRTRVYRDDPELREAVAWLLPKGGTHE